MDFKVDSEFEQIVDSLMQIEQTSIKEFYGKYLTFNKILSRLRKLVDLIKNLLTPDLTIMALKG